MEAFELILLLLLAVLLSSILDQVVPRVSSPLIQIALGVIIAFLSISPIHVDVDPELFLVLFIAPLLFNDSLEANKKNLWDNRKVVVSYAIGLVIVITLCVGFVLHWLVPSIPLAAAFALGAALGPTDAVAVQALRREAKIGKREGAILQGEALINDASGVVSFQFAIAAAVTGAFSLYDATITFFVSFFGGIFLGIVFAGICLFIIARVRELGLDNVTFHVLFEVSMPFVAFLISEMVGVSGILAVVACGIVWSMFRDRRISPYQSRLNLALSSVWRVVGFTLNGVVFVLLGVQLPGAMETMWESLSIGNEFLIGWVLLLTALIVGLRYLWALAMSLLLKNPDTGVRDKLSRRTLKNALITTVGGPKGAITLSIALSIPYLVADGSAFPQRSLIIFLASGVIICTLLIANFLLPVLAPKRDDEEEDDEELEELHRTQIEILRTVIERLMADSTDDNDRETKRVVSSYNARIRAIRSEADVKEPEVSRLRAEVIDYQAERLIQAMERKEVDSYQAFEYLNRLTEQKTLLTREKGKSLIPRYRLSRVRLWMSMLRRSIVSTFSNEELTDKASLDRIRAMCERYAIEYLSRLVNDPAYPSEVVAKLLIGHERALSVFDASDATVTSEVVEDATVSTDAIKRRGLELEREVIQDYYAAGNLTRAQTKRMMDNVSLMLMDLEEHV